MAKILLKQVLKQKDIKIEKFLPSLTISRSTLYNIFNGTKSPTINELEEFAKVLNVSIEDLYSSEYSIKRR